MDNDHVCPTCGGSLVAYWHKLTPGLVGTLVKVYRCVCSKNANLVHKKELILSHSEYGNFQKLRFHGLIARATVNGRWDRLTWLITKRGGAFLRGEIEVPQRVRTFKNAVTGHSEELTDIKGVLGTEPFFQQKFGFEFVDLLDDGMYIAGVPIKKKVRHGKKKALACPKCEYDMKRTITSSISPSDPMKLVVQYWNTCSHCHYKEETK